MKSYLPKYSYLVSTNLSKVLSPGSKKKTSRKYSYLEFFSTKALYLGKSQLKQSTPTWRSYLRTYFW